MDCYRVPINVWRADTEGRIVICQQQGPIITAPDPEIARGRAENVCGELIGFHSVGEPEFLHEHHRRRGARDRPPWSTPGLDESLPAMVNEIRAKRRSAA